MATVILYLYTDCKLVKDKNFVVDNLEDYLSSLSITTVADFQYQRFDIKKSIILNLEQVWQTKKSNLPYGDSTVAKKWNYLKVVNVVDGTPINYYYFITGYKQKAPNAVELELEMDTLNTFQFSNTYSNSAYTLSPKTIVKREHKDRWELYGIEDFYQSAPSLASEKNIINNWKSGSTIISPKELGILFDWTAFRIEYYSRTPAGITWPLTITANTALKKIVIVDGNGKIINSLIPTSVEITVSKITVNTTLGTTYEIRYKATQKVLFIIGGGSSSFSPSETWAYIDEWFLNTYVYTKATHNLYNRIIDEFQEGLSTQLFKKSEETLYDKFLNNQWYLSYESTGNAVQVKFYSDEPYKYYSASSFSYNLYAYDKIIPKWSNTWEVLNSRYNATIASESFIVNGNTYSCDTYFFRARRQNNSDMVFNKVWVYKFSDPDYVYNEYDNISFITLSNITALRVNGMWPGNETTISIPTTGVSGIAEVSKAWSELTLTDDKYIKVFAFPYCPYEPLTNTETGTTDSYNGAPEGTTWDTTNKCFELSKPQVRKFNYQLDFDVKKNPLNVLQHNQDGGPVLGTLRNAYWESKLYHSDYYQPKFVYDSFSFPFNLEFIDVNKLLDEYDIAQDSSLYITYIISGNIQSKFSFVFDQYITKKSTQDYENVLTIERNNEKALFNSAYLSYIKSGGFSYDQKKANQQNLINGITTALGVVGTIGSAVAGGPFGAAAAVSLGVSTIANVARGISTAQQQDQAISQKLLQLQMQGTTVEGCEDIDILTAISGNKAKLVWYELSDTMKQAMFDLFYYCGYATHEQKIPMVHTRTYFNFVQAEIEYKEYTFNKDIAEDIKNKWAAGITFLHHVNSSWDFDQQYENWEVSLLS